jgi:AraC-like DNA-binding protein
MDDVCNCMDKPIMNFFDGIQFVCGGCSPRDSTFNIRQFKDYYGIQYSQDGPFSVSVGDFKRTVSGPWALITHPGPVFQYGAPAGRQRLHAFVCFKGNRAEAYVRSGLLPIRPNEPLHRITRPERFLETLRQLVNLLSPLSNAHYPRAVNRLEDLLLQLHEAPSENGIVAEHWRTELVRLDARIREAPERNWDFQSIARGMGLSYPHFRRLFRQYSGMGPGHFLIHARLRVAATRLITTSTQLKALAEQCGFEDSFYFSRLFKKYFGRSPAHYRNEFQQQ